MKEDDESLAKALKAGLSGHAKRAFFIALVSLVLAVVLMAGSMTAYASWVGDRPMHGVSYLGQSLALLDQPAVESVVETQDKVVAQKTITVSIDGKPVELSLSEFSPTFDTANAVAAAKTDRTSHSVLDRALAIATTLWNGEKIPPAMTLGDIPPKLLALTSRSGDPVDATFIWKDDQLTVVPSQVGEALKQTQLLADVQRSAVDGSTVTATFTTINPKITTDALTALQPKALAMVRTALLVSGSGKTVTYKPETLTSWLDPVVSIDGTVELSVDQKKIASALVSIEAMVNKKTSPKKISGADGAVLAEGQAGVVVNRAVTTGLMVAELERRASGAKGAVVAASIQTTAPTEQTVQPDSTGGLYPGKYIEVDLSSQQLFQYEGSTLVATRRVSTGKWSTPTPVGSFSINSKVPRAYSKPFNLYMPYWMAFVGSSYGLHELPEWADGRKEGESHLGTPVSHGCIRMGVGEAGQVYDWAEIGTPVVVHS